MFNDDLLTKATELLALCRSSKVTLATAESCTGGLVSALLTEIPGASDVFERGFVTYSNESKTELLGVPAELIRKTGAVSYEVAEAMARGARKKAGVDIAVSITGIAGPGGESPDKPVGLVYIGVATSGGVTVDRNYFHGTRDYIRRLSVIRALALLKSSS